MRLRKMSLMPAQRLGVQSKGRLQAGADADIVVFSAERVIDRATFEDPAQYSVGIPTSWSTEPSSSRTESFKLASPRGAACDADRGDAARAAVRQSCCPGGGQNTYPRRTVGERRNVSVYVTFALYH
jgi:hypothetical protein